MTIIEIKYDEDNNPIKSNKFYGAYRKYRIDVKENQFSYCLNKIIENL